MGYFVVENNNWWIWVSVSVREKQRDRERAKGREHPTWAWACKLLMPHFCLCVCASVLRLTRLIISTRIRLPNVCRICLCSTVNLCRINTLVGRVHYTVYMWVWERPRERETEHQSRRIVCMKIKSWFALNKKVCVCVFTFEVRSDTSISLACWIIS